MSPFSSVTQLSYSNDNLRVYAHLHVAFNYPSYSKVLYSIWQVSEAKLIWVDRLGFDMRVFSQKGIFEVRIPFPREVTDVKGVKSTFNCMSQLAWEVEKNFHVPSFQKVKHLKQIL